VEQCVAHHALETSHDLDDIFGWLPRKTHNQQAAYPIALAVHLGACKGGQDRQHAIGVVERLCWLACFHLLPVRVRPDVVGAGADEMDSWRRSGVASTYREAALGCLRSGKVSMGLHRSAGPGP